MADRLGGEPAALALFAPLSTPAKLGDLGNMTTANALGTATALAPEVALMSPPAAAPAQLPDAVQVGGSADLSSGGGDGGGAPGDGGPGSSGGGGDGGGD